MTTTDDHTVDDRAHGVDITDLFNDPTLTHAEIEERIAEREALAAAGQWTNPTHDRPDDDDDDDATALINRPLKPFPWPVAHPESFQYFAFAWDVTAMWVWLERRYYDDAGGDLDQLGLRGVKAESLRSQVGFIKTDRDRLTGEQAEQIDLAVPLLIVEMRPEVGGGHQLVDGAHRVALALRKHQQTPLDAFVIGWRDAIAFERNNPFVATKSRDYVHPPCGATVTRWEATYTDRQTGLTSATSWFEMATTVAFTDAAYPTPKVVHIPATNCLNCATRLTLLRTSDNETNPLRLPHKTPRKGARA